MSFASVLIVFRTNAIHIGDRILAINDVCLRGKGLHEAIELLQTSGDEITLKISRTVAQQHSKKTRTNRMLCFTSYSLEDYTPSVDSAMESWDSSHADHRLGDHPENSRKEVITPESSSSKTPINDSK